MRVNVSVVRDPAACSLAAADDTLLREVLRRYEAQYDSVAAELTLNLASWEEEVSRIRGWVGSGVDGRVVPWGDWDYFLESSHTESERAADRFMERTSGRVVYEARLDEHDRVLEINDAFARLVGIDAFALTADDPSTNLLEMAARRFGSPAELVELAQSAGCFEADVSVGDRNFRVLLLFTFGTDGLSETTVLLVDAAEDELGVPFAVVGGPA